MKLEELFEIEKLEREYLNATHESTEELIFSDEEFSLLEAVYEAHSNENIKISGVYYDDETLTKLKDTFETIALGETVDVPSFLSEEQKKLVELLFEKLNAAEEVWEYEDENNWEFHPAINSVGVLFMLNEIDRDFEGEKDQVEHHVLTEEEFKFLSAVFDEKYSEEGLELGDFTFNFEELDYIRSVFSEADLLSFVELGDEKKAFIIQILDKASALSDEEQAELKTLEQLFESSLDEEGLSNVFSEQESLLLSVVFNKKEGQDGIQINKSTFTPAQINYLERVFKQKEAWDPAGTSLNFDEEQEEMVVHILDIFDEYLYEPFDESQIERDLEILFIMDQFERDEMQAKGEQDGDLLFNNSQFELLKAIYTENSPSELVLELEKLVFNKEELISLEHIFSEENPLEHLYNLEGNKRMFVQSLLETAIRFWDEQES
ncbi:hypothetical protein [Sediminitomix flava]|uniref:Uncharacterized protein n=1 Tax=Sediminitomix flava TaxID=379075 RepID=A0A315ZCZ0_SEDFL|nr:hypothetical protein [Sediminitomix flava]PWJ42963.1 hypothetical protein BC781_102510 [Sediminitomix flava]